MNPLVALFVLCMLLVAAEGTSKETLVDRKLTVLSKILGRSQPDEWCEVGECEDDDECDEYCVHERHYEYGHCEGDSECCCGPA